MFQQATVSSADSANRTTESAKKRIKQRVFRSSAKDTLPLTLRHERIYILPTTRGLAFICVIAIMLMASINYGLNLGYALCFILIGLFCSCLLSTYRNLVQVKLVHATAQDSFEGTPLIYTVTLADECRRSRCSINVSCDQANDMFDLQSNSKTDATLLIKQTRRGIHSLGRLTLSSDFPLGLWKAWGYVHTPVQANVYPKPEHPMVELPSRNTESDGQAASRRGEQEYEGLKTYENTDSPSRVAWKQVASGRGWYSKQFEAESEQQEIAIRWEDTPTNLSCEQRLSRMCSWVVRAMEENSVYTFELPGNFPAHNGTDRKTLPSRDSTTSNPLYRSSGPDYGKSCLRSLAAFKQIKPAPQ